MEGGKGGGWRVEGGGIFIYSQATILLYTHISLRDVCGVSTSSKLKGERQEVLVSDSYTLIPKSSTFPSSSFHYPQQVSLEEGRETFTQPNQVDCGPFNNCQSRD